MTIGVALITLHAKEHLDHCLPPVMASPLKPRVLVVNSTSGDGTIEKAHAMGAETLLIPRESFNHGATRELARNYLGTDIVVMMTQDAYPKDSSFVEKLVEPLLNGAASASYARQLPHAGASFFEAFPREYNYPAQSHVRSIKDLSAYGIYTYFCSDSAAAWVNHSLDDVGGFPSLLSHEDSIALGKLLHAGHRVAYVAEAEVYHSHKYGLTDEFKRSFDTGYVRALYRDVLKGATDEKRGVGYATELLTRIVRECPWMLAYAFMNLGARYIGYKVGAHAHRLPNGLKAKLSGQDYYWASTFHRNIQREI